MIPRNKLSVINTPFQGKPNRVLTVCSGGVLRSPTAAVLLTQPPYNFNTRSCGTEEYALIPITEELVYWADEIVVAAYGHLDKVEAMIKQAYIEDESQPLVHVLDIPDDFDYMDPEMILIMREKFNEFFGK